MDDDPAVPPVLHVEVRLGVGRRGRPTPRRPLGDDDLADEIELYGAVVVAASAKDGELSAAEIDDALGVPRTRRRAHPAAAEDGS